jgi:hypothetical protein
MKMKLTLRTLIGFVLFGSPAFPLVEHEINTKFPLQCSFSFNHQNRIVVSQGAVMKVVAPKEKFLIQIEENSGQAFILPFLESEDVSTFSIITSSGSVQDLEVTFVNKPSEVIFLKETEGDIDSLNSPRQSLDDTFVSQIRRVLIEEPLEGYQKTKLKDVKPLIMYMGLHSTPKEVYEGASDRIIIESVKNITKSQITLSPRRLSTLEDNWFYLEKEVLNPGESTLAVFSRRYSDG